MYGDEVRVVVMYMGMGGDGKNHGDGVGMGLIFNNVSLFSLDRCQLFFKISRYRFSLFRYTDHD